MDRATYIKKREECAQKIRATQDLASLPEITTTQRLVAYDDAEGLREFERVGEITVSPPGYYSMFTDYAQVLKDEYFQLFSDMNPEDAYRTYLITLRVSHGQETVSAGFKWDFIGTLRTGERFCAILHTIVKRRFRKCGLSSLLKLDEVELARSENCDFIQTFHETDNPHFSSIIIPNLKNRFVLHPGIKHKDELHTKGGFVHLRKYFAPIRNTDVIFKDGTRFESPDQNSEIIRHLLTFKHFPGKQIARIEGRGPRAGASPKSVIISKKT